jgi:hypothetical protein
VLEDASDVRFNLLDEVLNVPLYCMQVEFDRVKHDLVLAASRFETVSVHKFTCAIAAYGLGSMPPERTKLVQVLPRVLTCASVDHITEVRPDIQHHKRISLTVQSNRLLPMNAQSMCHSSRGATARLRMPASLRYVSI